MRLSPLRYDVREMRHLYDARSSRHAGPASAPGAKTGHGPAQSHEASCGLPGNQSTQSCMNEGRRFLDAGAFSGLAQKFNIQVQGGPGDAHGLSLHRGAGALHR